MSEEFRLKIERDNRGRVISRITENNGDRSTKAYFYNTSGDISEITSMENGVLNYKQEFRYEYDKYGNKITKAVELIDFINQTKEKSVYIYTNEYCENRITKKTCLYDGIRLYESVYYYKEDKIVRIERFNNWDGFALWSVELINYLESFIESTVYLANNVLSHYVIYKVHEDSVISKQIVNPLKGRYYWSLSSCGEEFCSVYVGEASLTYDVLSEILKYVLSVKKEDIEYYLVVIECSDTMADISDKRLRDVENYYSEQGLQTHYSP